MRKAKILIMAVASFILFDLIWHICELFGFYFYRFTDWLIYDLSWGVGWSTAFILLVIALILLQREGKKRNDR